LRFWKRGRLILRQLDEGFFEGGLDAGEFAQGPVVLAHDAVDVLADVDAGLGENFGLGPAVFVGEDDFDVVDVGEGLDFGDDVGAGGLDFKEDGAAAADEAGEVGGGVGGFDAAVVDDEDAGAGEFDFGEDVGGEEDGVVFAEFLDEVADGADLIGIEADGGFVEDEEVGVVDEGVGESDALAITLERVPMILFSTSLRLQSCLTSSTRSLILRRWTFLSSARKRRNSLTRMSV